MFVHSICSARLVGVVLLVILTSEIAPRLRGDEPLAFTIQLDVVKQELDPGFCWFHPRVASIPGRGKDGRPLVLLTLQKHLVADDHYSGLHVMTTADLGQTWTGPQLPRYRSG